MALLEQEPLQPEPDTPGKVYYLSRLHAGDGRWIYPSPKATALPPIKRARHEKPVPLIEETGMLDFDGMAMYLHPNPLSVPLYRGPGWKYHHIAFPYWSFEQTHLEAEQRTPNLRAFRRSSWMQVHMRIKSERTFHHAHEKEVLHPPQETIDGVIKDFDDLDMLGASAAYIDLNRGNSQYDLDPEGVFPEWIQYIPPMDIQEFLTDLREDKIRALRNPNILPQRIVTSAIKRMSLHLRGDTYLENLGAQRLAEDPVFYPLRVPSHKLLLDKAKGAIALEFLDDDSASPYLQRGVNELELAA